jgi:hypothetical protein
MAKKNRKSKKINEMDFESVEPDSSESTGESTSFDAGPQEKAGAESTEEQISAGTENESASEDLLDDVRRSLIEEEETDKNKKEAKWWRRLGRKEKSTESEPSLPIVEIDLPGTTLETDIAADQEQIKEPDEYEEEIDDLIDLLKAEPQESNSEAASVVEAEIPPEPEPEIDFEQLKEQAFRPRTSDEEAESDSDVRSIALEDGEEVFVEVESQAADPFEERLKALENALKPYRSYIYMTLAFLGIVMAVMASFLIFNVYRQSRPEPVKEVSNLPYPVAVSLPGGWSFNLGRGTLQGGKWEPSGAEWLEGTEVCRWVSLPWSRQLEAVIRTLNPKDPIELVMSNNDKLVYGVYSVHEMTVEEIQELDANSPCLLIILTGSDSEKRWALTALP